MDKTDKLPTVTYCESCDYHPDREFDYCPDCGAEDPWVKEPKYEFDSADLPFVFSMYIYNDGYKLWNAFCEDYFGTRLKGSHIANLPDNFPRMKVIHFEVYFVVTESFELEGPYLTEEGATEVIDDG